MKFYVETFGCQMNVADSREMSRHLMARGLVPTERISEADCVLVNTCTVRQHAEDRAVSYVGRLADWKDGGPRRLLIVAGCAAERMGDLLKKRLPHVDVVFGAKSIDRFDQWMSDSGFFAGSPFNGEEEHRDAWGGDLPIPSLLPGESSMASVTIMRGCDYACSYCVVPAVRGREKYRPAASLLAEVSRKVELGVKDILLLGQTVNSYRPDLPNPGPDGKDVVDFADLLAAVDAVPGLETLRFMSPHPTPVNEKLAKTIAACPRVSRQLHLPVQSGSDALLRRMRRGYTRELYLRKLALLRRWVPDLSVTTDFIVGFPGETEADFESSVSLVEEAGFKSAYIFKYSPRPGTGAASFPDDVPEKTKEERHARLLALLKSRAPAAGARA